MGCERWVSRVVWSQRSSRMGRRVLSGAVAGALVIVSRARHPTTMALDASRMTATLPQLASHTRVRVSA